VKPAIGVLDGLRREDPSYLRNVLAVSAAQLSTLEKLGDLAFQDPVPITRDGLIIDGYARVVRARILGRTTILCIEYDRTEEEALRDLLRRHFGSNRLNAFCRILLAGELEPWFKKKALANQTAGGENKGSSKLMGADFYSGGNHVKEWAACSGSPGPTTMNTRRIPVCLNGYRPVRRVSIWVTLGSAFFSHIFPPSAGMSSLVGLRSKACGGRSNMRKAPRN
jgi:hypothetical protein